MRSLWSTPEAERMAARYGEAGIGRDLALRVYTSRLLGGDPQLVLHGGGNTSVKTAVADLLGETAEVLCVKGSGWDMAAIEPARLPAGGLAARGAPWPGGGRAGAGGWGGPRRPVVEPRR